jgi:phage terminase small subunit
MLTQKKIKFAQKYFECGNAVESYKTAYNCQNMKDKSIRDNASKLLKDTDITQYLSSLNAKVDKKAIMSYQERMIWLTKVINGEITHTSYDSNGNAYDNEAYISDKLKSIDILNKMDNSYQQNIKIEGTLNNPLNGLTEEELRKLAEQ